MRSGRSLVLVLALASAAGAAMIVRNAATAPIPATIRPEIAMAEVLVANRALTTGQMVEAKDGRWQPWPAAALPKDAIRRVGNAAQPAFTPGPARHAIAEGEPISDAKLVRPGEGGVMAALIAPGKRAVAVAVREESAAGGFIQPLDRVDVLWTQRTDAGTGGAKSGARVLLRGAKVLAIGKALAAKDAGSAEGRTATLELTPEETRIIADVRTGGEISLALIPAADAPSASGPAEGAANPPPAVQILRFGRRSPGRTDQ